MNQAKKKCPGAAATVQSTSNSTHDNNNILNQGCKEDKSLGQKVLECYNEIEPMIYMAERLLLNLERQYFWLSDDGLQGDVEAQKHLIREYEFIQVQVSAISQILFDIRVKCEFVGGAEDESIIAAHIKREEEMRSWLSHKVA